MMILLAASLAYAGSLGPGVNLPGAAPLDPGGYAGVTGGILYDSTLAGGEAGFSSGRFALGAAGSFVQPDNAPMGMFSLGARYQLVHTPVINLAVIGVSGLETGFGEWGTTLPSEEALGYSGLGLALDVGNEVVRFDLSTTPFGVWYDPQGFGSGDINLLATEAGLSFVPYAHHRVRFGNLGAGIVGSYRYDAPRWYVEGQLGYEGMTDAGLAGVTLGAKF